MTERDRSNQLMIWTLILVTLVVLGSVGLVWSSGNPLPSKLVPAKPKAEAPPAPSADAVTGLEKRVVELESKKAPPTFDTSGLEAQLKGLQSQLATVQTQLGTFRVSDFDALQTKIDSLKMETDRAAKANSTSVKTIDALQADVGNLTKRFDQLSQQVLSATPPDIKHTSQKPQHSRPKQ